MKKIVDEKILSSRTREEQTEFEIKEFLSSDKWKKIKLVIGNAVMPKGSWGDILRGEGFRGMELEDIREEIADLEEYAHLFEFAESHTKEESGKEFVKCFPESKRSSLTTYVRLKNSRFGLVFLEQVKKDKSERLKKEIEQGYMAKEEVDDVLRGIENDFNKSHEEVSNYFKELKEKNLRFNPEYGELIRVVLEDGQSVLQNAPLTIPNEQNQPKSGDNLEFLDGEKGKEKGKKKGE